MKSNGRTAVDPTLLVPEGDRASGARAVLLVYGDVGAGEHSRLLELADGVTVAFGRSRKCAVHIDSDAVSRTHAQLTRSGRRFCIEDLGSRNGTRVNGELVSGSRDLASGDEITVGPITAVLAASSAVTRHHRLGTTAYLQERLEAECDRGHRYSRKMAVVMLRLQGPEAKIDEAVELLASRMRPMDSLCEYSPEELCVVLPELDLAGAQQVADRLAREARGVMAPTASAVRLGLALFPDHGTSPDELIGNARAALKVALVEDREIAAPPARHDEASMIARDSQMTRVLQLVEKVADSSITVLIYGETGVGKEIVSGLVHKRSRRAHKSYVRLNCASIPETLLESELFGHEKGAFTGAERRKEGYFEAANGGTIFLDEIGEISASVQAKLLRVLENKSISRVGGTKEIPVDVRIVCATNRDLDLEVREGRFREDLFYRISAFSLMVPPLRDRPADVIPMCEHFLRQSSNEQATETPVLSAQARALLAAYDWPGNVRQLRNAMERAVVLATDGIVNVADLPDRLRQATSARPGSPLVVGDSHDMRDQLADMEMEAIQSALAAAEGNQTRASKALGLSRRALIYKMEKYGLKEPPASRRKS